MHTRQYFTPRLNYATMWPVGTTAQEKPLTIHWFEKPVWNSTQLAALLGIRQATLLAWVHKNVPMGADVSYSPQDRICFAITQEAAIAFMRQLLHGSTEVYAIASAIACQDDAWWDAKTLAKLFGTIQNTVREWLPKPKLGFVYLTGPPQIVPNRTLNILQSAALEVFVRCAPDEADAYRLAVAVLNGQESYISSNALAAARGVHRSTIQRVSRTELPYVTLPSHEHRQKRLYIASAAQEWLAQS